MRSPPFILAVRDSLRILVPIRICVTHTFFPVPCTSRTSALRRTFAALSDIIAPFNGRVTIVRPIGDSGDVKSRSFASTVLLLLRSHILSIPSHRIAHPVLLLRRYLQYPASTALNAPQLTCSTPSAVQNGDSARPSRSVRSPPAPCGSSSDYWQGNRCGDWRGRRRDGEHWEEALRFGRSILASMRNRLDGGRSRWRGWREHKSSVGGIFRERGMLEADKPVQVSPPLVGGSTWHADMYDHA
ncbi:hypothetical protein LXA43DRAFT_347503 [Ganoderma leucocontextum]|nr:hypothetical protein LXA43DRAFT_347503 [Ganoderma leucocontextum]